MKVDEKMIKDPPVAQNVVKSEPPEGKEQVTNIYRNPADNKLVIKYKTT